MAAAALLWVLVDHARTTGRRKRDVGRVAQQESFRAKGNTLTQSGR